MKSEIIKNKKSPRTYPRLMKLKETGFNVVVLFSNSSQGIVVSSDSTESPVGNNSPWEINLFEDFTDKIILSNN